MSTPYETITTLAPVWARLIAVFTAVVVFPSQGRLEVISRDRGARPAVESNTEVRRWRYDSASGERPSTFIKSSGFEAGFPLSFCSAPDPPSRRRRVPAPTEGITAKAGKWSKRSTSSVE